MAKIFIHYWQFRRTRKTRRQQQKKWDLEGTCGWKGILTCTKCNKIGSLLFWNSTTIWIRNGAWKYFSLLPFWEIAFSRFFLNELRPEMTNLRGKITKGSTFKSDWSIEKGQYLSSPCSIQENKLGQFLDKSPYSIRRGKYLI